MRVATKAESVPERLALAAGIIPTPLLETFEAMAMARTVMAGASLGVFDALAEQQDDAAGLARRLDLDPDGADILMVALHALGYVEERDGRFRNAPAVERFVLRDSPHSLRDYVEVFNRDMWDEFSCAEHAIRTGETSGLHSRPADDPYWERYMRGLFDLTRLAGDDVAKMIGARSPRRMLDLAGGHGGYAIAMCRRHPELTVTIAELEGAARIARRIVDEQGMGDRIEFLVGDMFEVDLGDGYDVATAFQILHHFDSDRNVELLTRARTSLCEGGTVAVLEQERPPSGERGSTIGALTGLLFFITSRARTYTADELATFVEAAGFDRVRRRRSQRFPGHVVVTGRA
ncbi:MAG TPA: class I SAM-dependent methyltransferase [Thermoleophilaceae bacterium]|nr:class I SAM-dependent methyltransferase [Thermoleophilaceae bacterium]